MTWWNVLVLNVVFFTGCVSRRSRIFNGLRANIEDFPYQASLRRRGSHFCGGSIISERHVLTAAHCIKEGMAVHTGTSYRSEEGKSHRIEKIKIHSNFSTNENRVWNDIAVITLKDKIVFDKYQQKISLPEHSPEVGQKVNATGWGWTQQTPIIRPYQLQHLQTQLASNEDCQKKLIDPETSKMYDTEICTLDAEGTGMCAGDSGGPLAANGVIFGIAAWIDGKICASGNVDVFTNVYKYKNFIETAMNDTSIARCIIS